MKIGLAVLMGMAGWAFGGEVSVDVAVVGGGSAGFGAALAAARAGAEVLLVERAGMLGGTSTVGGVCNWEPDCAGAGLAEEVYGRMRRKPGAAGVYAIERHCMWDDPKKGITFPGSLNTIDPKADYSMTLRRHGPGMGNREWFRENCRGVIYEPRVLAETMMEMLKETGRCRVMLGTAFVGCRKGEGGRVEELRLSDGTAVKPRMVVDACGAVCAAAGCKVMRSARPNGATLIYRVAPGAEGRMAEEEGAKAECWWGKFPYAVASRLPCGEVVVNMLPTMGGAEALGMGRAECYAECRRRVFAHWAWMKRRWPEYAGWRIKEVAEEVAFRETARIEGEYVLTVEDVRGGVRHADDVTLADHALDSHGGDGFGGELERPYGVPFRCLVPKGLANVLIAGRCASFDERAASSCRLQRAMMRLGEAAGRFAARRR